MEKSVAADLGGRVQPGSGATSFAKGDIRLANFLLEHKFTDAASYSLRLETFEKIESEARAMVKLPAMVIDIQGRKLVIMRYDDISK